MEEIIFEGITEYEDFAEYNKIYTRNRYLVSFIMLFIAFLMIFSTFLLTDMNTFSKAILSIFLAIGSSFLVILLLKFIFYKKLKSIYNSNSRAKLTNIYFTNEKGIMCKNERGETLFHWEEIFKVIVTKRLILIYASINQALIIPKRFFNTVEDELSFIDIIKNNVSKEKIKINQH